MWTNDYLISRLKLRLGIVELSNNASKTDLLETGKQFDSRKYYNQAYHYLRLGACNIPTNPLLGRDTNENRDNSESKLTLRVSGVSDMSDIGPNIEKTDTCDSKNNLISCRKCGSKGNAYWMKLHTCEIKPKPLEKNISRSEGFSGLEGSSSPAKNSGAKNETT